MFCSIVRHWTGLVSLTLTGMDVRPDLDMHALDHTGAFTPCHWLRTLIIRDAVPWSLLSELLITLPASVRTLALRLTTNHGESPPNDEALACLAAVAPQAVRFKVTQQLDEDEYSNDDEGAVDVSRGVLDDIVLRLTAVRHLTLDPHAVSNLATALAPLSQLAELVLARPRDAKLPVWDATELVALTEQSSSLKSVTVGKKVSKGWTARESRMLGRVARRERVEVVWE